ncbi:MAG: glutamine amidotransferase [Clostridia bacterium]|nr:glutamine amidotransferase [Clostridia bacterium]
MKPNEKKIRIYHLYPELLNLYGDAGNVLAFQQRCLWRGMEAEIIPISPEDRLDFGKADFIFIGGGSDREQMIASQTLSRQKAELKAAIEDGVAVLAICGGLQLLGQYYKDTDGDKIPGLGLLDFYTEAGTKRLIGNIAIEMEIEGKQCPLVGFENHAGRTFLGEVAPLGRVLKGFGNNGQDGGEGIRYHNVFCSYLHGPILPKNTCLADYLLKLVLQRRGESGELLPLDDSFEEKAVQNMLATLI